MNVSDCYSVKIINKKVIVLPDYHDKVGKTESKVRNMLNVRKMAWQGKMSNISKSKVERILDTWYKINETHNKTIQGKNSLFEKRFVMITLTLPSKQTISDKEIKSKYLAKFLQLLIQKEDVKNYIWRAESQVNGNIHFHIVIDKYVPYPILYSYWLSCLKNSQMLIEFYEKFPNVKPPFLNVKGQAQMQNPVSYITKYISKEENVRKIEGAVWRCSYSLSRLKPFEIIIDNNDLSELLIRLEKESKRCHIDTFFSVFIINHMLKVSDLFVCYRKYENLYYLTCYKYLQQEKDPSKIEMIPDIQTLYNQSENKKPSLPPAPQIPQLTFRELFPTNRDILSFRM